jgi:uncharacterized protein (DUF2147 family)
VFAGVRALVASSSSADVPELKGRWDRGNMRGATVKKRFALIWRGCRGATRGFVFSLVALFFGFSDRAGSADLSGIWVVRAPTSWPDWIRDWVGESYGISFIKDGTKYCGILSWIKDVSDGQPVDKDKENTNPVLRDRELLGLTIASELSVQSGNLTSGRLYFPASGKYHAIKISFEKPDVKRAIVESTDVVLKYGWCPLCWEFKQITLEKRMAIQLPPPIKGSGPCRFQE